MKRFAAVPVAAAVLLTVIVVSRPSPGAAAAPGAHRSATRAASPAHAVPAPAAKPGPSLQDEAVAARLREDEGSFGMAMESLRRLRGRTAPDADLELWLAIDEARCGESDSAWARLDTPLMRAALADTAPPARWHEYGARRALQWIDGRFTGWHWYVAHARAEVALERGDWAKALEAARIAADAQPLVGREHLLLAIAAGRAGDDATARREASLAAELDPLLPEARYLTGVWAWRDGERLRARREFEAAIAGDSAYRSPAIALVRLRLPGTRPDSLPTVYLTGERRIAQLTSPERPKPEEDVRTDTPAGLYGQAPELVVADSLKATLHMTRPIKLYVTVLVDEAGRPVTSYFQYMNRSTMPVSLLQQVLDAASKWRFRPATRFGQPVRAWISVEFMLNPHP